MKDPAALRSGRVLPLPRFVLHPITTMVIAAMHIYLAFGHLSRLVGGDVEWTHIWKGFGALGGAYVFAALTSRGLARRAGRHLPANTPLSGTEARLDRGSA